MNSGYTVDFTGTPTIGRKNTTVQFTSSVVEIPTTTGCWWRFNDGSGATIKDWGVPDLDGTWEGTAEDSTHWTLSEWGKFASSTGDYVNVGNSGYLNATSALTVGGWVNRTQITTMYDAIIKKGKYALECSNYQVGTLKYMVKLWICIGGSWYATSESGMFNQNQAQHIVGVYNGSTISLYENGVVVSAPISASGSIDTDTSALWLGNDPANNTRYWNGYMKNMRMYNTALTEAEVLAWYNE